MKIRPNLVPVVTCLILLGLAGCRTTEQRLQNVSEEISAPPETMLLASQVQARQGSQDSCYFTSLFELYGSKLPIEKVIGYYSAELINSSWTEVIPSWQPENENEDYLLFQRDNTIRVAISEALPVDIDYLFDEFPEPSVPYTTIYLLTMTYADAITQRDCPVW